MSSRTDLELFLTINEKNLNAFIILDFPEALAPKIPEERYSRGTLFRFVLITLYSFPFRDAGSIEKLASSLKLLKLLKLNSTNIFKSFFVKINHRFN